MSSLELEEDERFRHREWRVQRVGWTVVTIAFLAAAVGGWGDGPVSHAVQDGEQAQLEYTRVVHRQTRDDLQIRGPGPTITLAGDWIDAVDIERIIPEPESMSADADGLTLQFEQEQLHVEVGFQARHLGPLHGMVEIADERLPLNQVVLP